MRTAAVCPTCSTYTNALCVIYNGDDLDNIQATSGMSMEEIVVLINNAFPAYLTTVINAPFLGKLAVDAANYTAFIAVSTDLALNTIWKQLLVVDIATTAGTSGSSGSSGGVPEYADNNAAVVGGLQNNDLYRTGDVLKIVHS